ncbi:MAG: imidazoleglycerol-phosphate dehydratase HisB [Chthonomonadales bacterium]|nr:imidazoleglycerol-phosphate dehydratase HisB [Chthonomonadales bacterium]
MTPQGTPAPREALVRRATSETEIELRLSLDGAGEARTHTGVGFLDHMLAQVARHGMLDLSVQARGDLHVDDHHTVEDVGIALGAALREALGDRAGVARYGDAVVPMDEALVLCALDLSGRGLSVCALEIPAERIGGMAAEMVPEFFRAVAHNAGMTLHLRQLGGTNSHHIVEAAFKAFARSLRQAVSCEEGSGAIPSTKGSLQG